MTLAPRHAFARRKTPAPAALVITVTDVALASKATSMMPATTRCPPRGTLHHSPPMPAFRYRETRAQRAAWRGVLVGGASAARARQKDLGPGGVAPARPHLSA